MNRKGSATEKKLAEFYQERRNPTTGCAFTISDHPDVEPGRSEACSNRFDDLPTGVSQREDILFDHGVGQVDEFAHDRVEASLGRSTIKSEIITCISTGFIMSSLPLHDYDRHTLCDEVYHARGDTENRKKDKQLGLSPDRTSSSQMQAI